MSKRVFSWKIEDFIAKGTPLVEEERSFSPLDWPDPAQAKSRPFESEVHRSTDRHSAQFRDYVVSAKRVEKIAIQIERISDKGGLLDRIIWSFSDVLIETIRFTGTDEFLDVLIFSTEVRPVVRGFSK